MRRFHLILGLIVVIVFLLTGQYMEYVQLPDGMRMLYRSRTIHEGTLNKHEQEFFSCRFVLFRGSFLMFQ